MTPMNTDANTSRIV